MAKFDELRGKQPPSFEFEEVECRYVEVVLPTGTQQITLFDGDTLKRTPKMIEIYRQKEDETIFIPITESLYMCADRKGTFKKMITPYIPPSADPPQD